MRGERMVGGWRLEVGGKEWVIVGVLLVALGCGGTGSGGTVDVGGDPDVVADMSGGDVWVELDAGVDVAPDVPDVTNQAALFVHNPVKDDWQTERVVLPHIDNEEGLLSSPFANVFNCLNEEGGWVREYEVPLLGLVHAQLCNITKTVTPDEDGSYLSVVPPEDLLDPDDSFAELMMYYHVNTIHDYYATVHGYTGMDFPLESYVNLMAYLEMENPLPGVPTGWVTFDNAMFMPGESFQELEEMAEMALKEYLGIEDDLALPFQNDAIFFMQGESLDFAYDADVIYHEYTHAVVGGDRLFATAADEYGPDAAPRALNEAYADYFSSSVMGDPLVSEFALETLSAGRDISEFHKCPDGYHGEEHIDGLMYSSALWDVREALGQELADGIIFDGLLTLTQQSSFEDAAQATIAEAALLDPPRDAEVEAIFDEHGLLGCNRRMLPYQDFMPGERYPAFMAGTQTTGIGAFAEAAPGYVQYRFEVAEETAALRLEVTAQSSGMASMLGGLLGQAGEIALSVALKRGEEPITYTYEPEYSHTEDGVVALEKVADGLFAVVISGTCLEPGPHMLQLLNRSADSVMVTSMSLTPVTEELPETANYECSQAEEN